MGDIKHDILNEVLTGAWKALTGFATYLVIVLLSVLGMIGNNMFLGKKMTFWQSVGLAMLALCSTMITAIICYRADIGLKGYIITGIIPYVCDKAAMFLMGFDWNKNFKTILRDWFKGMADKLK